MEIGALEHYVGRRLIGAATLAAEDAGDTHRLLGIADAQVVLAQRVLLAIEGDKPGAFGLGAHHNLVALHHVGIKAVHGLSVGHHHIVGDVDNIVDGAQTDGAEFVLQPLGTLLHLASRDAQTGITLACLGILNLHLDGQVVVVDSESAAVGAMERSGTAILLEIGIEVAGNTPVREGISAVGRNVDLNQPVALEMKIFGSGLPNRCIVGQHNDTIMAAAHTYFVFGTDHAAAFHSAEL